jgi:hypothetical protein
MSEQSTTPIPRDLAEAFDNAVGLYEIWKWGPGQTELEVFSNAQRFSMSAVCGFVHKFTDPLPGYLVDWLYGSGSRRFSAKVGQRSVLQNRFSMPASID